MKIRSYFTSQMNWLLSSLTFFKRHFAMIFGLGLIAAFGRVIQLGGFREISSGVNIILEVIIETSRVLIFLYVLGLSNIPRGVRWIKEMATNAERRKSSWKFAVDKLKHEWRPISLNIFGFLIIAGVFNLLIDLLAYETCLYLTLKKDGILAENSSEWTILLFFKNISVIPFTLVFNGLFILWITNQVKGSFSGLFVDRGS